MRKQEKKNEALKYVVNRIIRECKKNNYSRIGLSTSMEKNPYLREFSDLCKKKFAEKEVDVQIKELPSICHYAEALEEAQLCDAIILVERYLYTTYSDMDKAVELLKSLEIHMMGVVNVK